jgi:exodeoxyribonuclease III
VVYAPFAGPQLQRLQYKTRQYEPAIYRHCERTKERGKGVLVVGNLNTAVDYLDAHITATTNSSPGFTKKERDNLRLFLRLGWHDTHRSLHP